jgi:hypothetical protein
MIDPRRIAVQAALRILHLTGTSQATLEASYQAGLSELDGADVPVSALKDAVVAVEAEIADLVAGDKQNPYRSTLYDRSDDLESGEEIPTISENGIAFIGIFSGVNDSEHDKPLTEGAIQEILRYNRGSYLTEIRKFKFFNGRLYHTMPEAYIEGCSWSRQAAIARLDDESTELSPLPEVFEAAWVSRTIAFLAQEGWLGNEAGYYQNFADVAFNRIRSRSTDLPTLPVNESSSNVVTN